MSLTATPAAPHDRRRSPAPWPPIEVNLCDWAEQQQPVPLPDEDYPYTVDSSHLVA